MPLATTRTRFFGLLSLLCCSLTLFGCGGGGGSGDGSDGDPRAINQDPEINLTATALTLITPNPEIGFPIQAEISLMSDKPAENVSVSLFIMEPTDDPEAEVAQTPIGSNIIEKLSTTEETFPLDVNIPSSVDTAGEYNIVAIVDPADEFFETDEDDNSAALSTMLSLPLNPNIFISELELDRASLEIKTTDFDPSTDLTEDNVYNADAAATLTVGADGLEADQTIDIEAFATLRLMRSDVGTQHDVPLYLWNTAEERYMNAYGVDPSGNSSGGTEEWLPLGTFEPQLVTRETDDTETPAVVLNGVEQDASFINFYFPGKLGSIMAFEMRYGHLTAGTLSNSPSLPPPDLNPAAISSLRAFLRNLPTNNISGDESDAMAVMSFEICLQVRLASTTSSDLSPDDNESCAPLVITLPPLGTSPPTITAGGYSPKFSTPSNPLMTSNGFKTQSGGSAFKFGIDFGGTSSADVQGYKETIHAKLPVTIFGVKSSFLDVDVSAQLVPDYPGKPAEDDNSFRIEISHIGQVLTRVVEIPGNTDISFKLDELSFSKEMPDPKKKGIAESTIFVGPIPLSAGAYVSGNLGVDFKPFSFREDHPAGYRLGIAGGPFANLEGVMYAGIGSRRLPVIVGVEGVLTLLDERIEFFNGVEIEYLENQPSEPIEFIISQGPVVRNIFTGPQGKLNLFAQYTVPKIKKCKVGLIKIPCPGFAKVKATKNIWKSKALFRFKDVIYENPNAQLSVVIPNSGEPLYFVP